MKTFAPQWLHSSANNYLVFGLRLAIAAIFIIAGLSKTTAPIAEFIGLAKQWNILPDPWVTIYAFTLPWLELICGLLILLGIWHRPAAALVVLMLISFLIAISINLARGTAIENCGCFGGWINLGESFTDLLWRDSLMLLATLWIMVTPKPLWISAERWLTKS